MLGFQHVAQNQVGWAENRQHAAAWNKQGLEQAGQEAGR